MDADLSGILAPGLAAVAFAVAALVLLVRRDLAPSGAFAGALDGGGRWFLGAALGLGIIAFSIKLAIISTLAAFPGGTIAPLLPEDGERQARAAILSARPTATAGAVPDVFQWQALPATAPAPSDNPTTPEKAALGRTLFHDPTLSWDGTVSCASCHDVSVKGGADGLPTARGLSGQVGGRNTPTVVNAAFQARLFWDGRAESLEEQAVGPLLNPIEMGMPSAAAVEERLRSRPDYRAAFERAFGPGAEITILRVAQAIAAFERTLITPDTPYDRFVRGDETALTPAQRRGMARFQALGCVMCHSGPNFSGASLVGPRNPFAVLRAAGTEFDFRHHLTDDKGLAAPDSPDGIWRIPSLRQVARTAPYFHNGSVTDLEEAVRLMGTLQARALVGMPASGEHRLLWWSPDRHAFVAFDRNTIDDQDVADIVAFLHALGDDG